MAARKNSTPTTRADNTARTQTARGLCLLLAALSLCPPVLGCGGGMSQDDLKRRAIRRPKEKEEEQPVAAGKPTRSTTAANSGDKPAAPDRAEIARLMAETAVVGNRPSPSAPTASAPTATPRKAEEARYDPAPTSSSPALTEPDPGEAMADGNLDADRPEQPQQRSLMNLRRIGQALKAYAEKNRRFPMESILDPSKKPALSWRVALLPYLGHGELYAQFRLDERWDSPHNIKLISQIPSVYQSPERKNATTNYLALVGSNTAFRRLRPVSLRKIEDGLSDTAVVVEVDDPAAAPWTKPEDYWVSPHKPRENLGQLRQGGFLVLWADGQATFAPTMDERKWWAMLSIDGHERFLRQDLNPPRDKATSGQIAAVDDNPVGAAEEPAGESPPDSSAKAAAAAKSFAHLAWTSELSEEDLLLYLHAARVLDGLDDAARVPEMGWAPALNRPLLALRWGVGMQYSPLRGSRGDADPIPADKQSRSSAPADLTRLTGELGHRAWSELEARCARGAFGDSLAKLHAAATPKRGQQESAPGIHWLEQGSERELLHVAGRQRLDVLLLFEVVTKPVRGRAIHNTTTMRIMDVDSGKTLYSADSLNNIQVNLLRQNRLREDPVDEEFRSLLGFIDRDLQLGQPEGKFDLADLPSKIAGNARRGGPDALKMLSELLYYQSKGGVTTEEFYRFEQDLLSPEDLRVLRDSDRQAKELLLAKWIRGSH